MGTVNITKDNFQETIENNDIVLLDFYAGWCGPCRSFGPIFEKSSEKHPDIIFGKINTEAEPDLAGALNIRSIPTVMVFRQNVQVFSQAGALPEAALESLIEQVKGLDMEAIKQEILEKKAEESK